MINKHYIIYFLVFLLVNVSFSIQLAPVPLSIRRTDLIESQSCEQSGWSCKDCSTLQRCGPDSIFKFQISCGDQFPDRPYCDPSIGRCVSDRHVCTEMKDPEFKCPDIGIYPDLSDCGRYISCRAKGEVGLIYSCLFQSVYNPIAKRCITNSYCYDPMIDCSGEYKTIAYIPDPSLYIVCRGDQKPLIKDCGSKMLEYDPSLLACDFKCKEEGRFAHPTNNTLFYICVFNDNEIVRMMGLCREGTIYDEIYDTCVYYFDLITTTQLMEEITETVTELETVTEEEILETTTENVSETPIDNNDQNFDTTTENVSEIPVNNNDQNSETTTAAVIEEQNSESTFNVKETTTDYKHRDETTINNQDFETTTEDTFPSVTIDGGQETSTEGAIEENTITENIFTEETVATSNGLEESNTIFTTENITTNSNEVNVTNSSEESLETTEKNDTKEENDVTKESNDTEENDSNEETEDTKEDNTKEDLQETDSTEQTEESREINSNENDDSNQTEENNNNSEETNKTKEKNNELKDKKHKCIGRICLPDWKIPEFLKRNSSKK